MARALRPFLGFLHITRAAIEDESELGGGVAPLPPLLLPVPPKQILATPL